MQTVQTTAIDRAKPTGADEDAFLTSAQVRASVGNVTNMCLWRWQRDPRVLFPEPDRMINGRRYWFLGTIRRWKERGATKAAA